MIEIQYSIIYHYHKIEFCRNSIMSSGERENGCDREAHFPSTPVLRAGSSFIFISESNNKTKPTLVVLGTHFGYSHPKWRLVGHLQESMVWELWLLLRENSSIPTESGRIFFPSALNIRYILLLPWISYNTVNGQRGAALCLWNLRI